MSDLISRKKQLETIEILMNGAKEHREGDSRDGYIEALVALKILIENEPTACDLDKVVEALISESSFVAEMGLRLIPVIEAIKIVKKGGV